MSFPGTRPVRKNPWHARKSLVPALRKALETIGRARVRKLGNAPVPPRDPASFVQVPSELVVLLVCPVGTGERRLALAHAQELVLLLGEDRSLPDAASASRVSFPVPILQPLVLGRMRETHSVL